MRMDSDWKYQWHFLAVGLTCRSVDCVLELSWPFPTRVHWLHCTQLPPPPSAQFSDLPKQKRKTHSGLFLATASSPVTSSTTGNSAGRRISSRRSAMSTPSPSTPTPALAAAASNAVRRGAFDPCSLATVAPPSPPKLSLEQLKQCSEALSFFKKKVKNTATITQEFSRLQVIFWIFFFYIDLAWWNRYPESLLIGPGWTNS